jgi:hypothetical protein
MLLYVLECCVMVVLLLIGVTQVVIPILQGKAMFPMLHQPHVSFDERLKGIEAELERGRRMDQIGKEVEDMFESSLEIQPSQKEKGKN